MAAAAHPARGRQPTVGSAWDPLSEHARPAGHGRTPPPTGEMNHEIGKARWSARG